MARQVTLKSLAFSYVEVTEKTQWHFAEVHDNDGCRTTVEITCGDMSSQVISYLSELVSSLQGISIDNECNLVGLLGLETNQIQVDFPLATAVSALRTALVQFGCWHEGASITEALGGTVQESVELYANINRSILGEWTTRNFSTAAELAVSKDFRYIKCAPFDDMNPDVSRSDNLAQANVRVERVAAVRSVVGPGVRIFVDCHGYLSIQSAISISEEMANLDVGWFEEPLRPNVDPEGLGVVTNEVNLPVAGGEAGYGIDFFADLVKDRVVDIIMPDIKYCGGLIEAVKSGRLALEAGADVSLHNPSGPISQLASAHVTAALSSEIPLEYAINEVPWRAELLEPAERIENGRIWIPAGIELGAILNKKVSAKYGKDWSI